MKAILVLDEMPKSCTDCRLKRGLYCGGENSNSLYNYIQYYDSINDKPSWCPLKSMPSRKDDHESEMVGSIQMDIGYTLGWNECLEEIEK